MRLLSKRKIDISSTIRLTVPSPSLPKKLELSTNRTMEMTARPILLLMVFKILPIKKVFFLVSVLAHA